MPTNMTAYSLIYNWLNFCSESQKPVKILNNAAQSAQDLFGHKDPSLKREQVIFDWFYIYILMSNSLKINCVILHNMNLISGDST